MFRTAEARVGRGCGDGGRMPAEAQLWMGTPRFFLEVVGA